VKWIWLLILLLTFLGAKGQVLTQAFIDPCSGKVTVVTVPIANGKTTVVYRGQSRVITANDITTGALQAWINNLTINYPCPQATVAVQQTVAGAVQQAVAAATSQATSQATSSATSAAASAAASAAMGATPPPPPPPPVNTTPPPAPSGGGGSTPPPAESKSGSPPAQESKSETKSETKSESKEESKSETKEEKSESKSEKKSESKKESKSSSKSQARVNPIIYSSDFTVAPAADADLSIIASLGMSQSSLMGNTSWGLSSMIWSTFNQFALSGRYTIINFNNGKLDNISNFGITGVYLAGIPLGFATAASIFPFGKWGTTGVNYTFSVAGADEGLNLSNNILLFYTVPVPVSKRLTISPDIYLSGSSTGYLTAQKKFITSNDVGVMTGASFDIALTKRFKFNFALKTSLNTNPIVPPTYFGMIGTKINL
jgi:hypothetical protein